MSMGRRKAMAIIGGGVIFGATATFLGTRKPAKALAPWQQAGDYAEPRRRALSYAILAPNSHNRQPWLVDLAQQDKIILYVDTDRMLHHTDPFNRQITIGLGCFLELLRMAAAQDGYLARITPFPQGFDNRQLDKRPVAEIAFTHDHSVKKDPLFPHILNRRSLKVAFDPDRQIPDELLRNLQQIVQHGVQAGTTNRPERVRQLRRLTHEAMAIEMETPRTYRESVDLYRIGKTEINDNPDGISLGGPVLDSLAAVGLFTRAQALDTGSSAYQQGMNRVMENMDSAVGYIWLTTETNSRLDQLNAGRDWVRVNLAATAGGIGLHPISQALQEFPEMTAKFNQLHEILDAKGTRVQMLGRLGYAAPAAPTPRWPLTAKIIKA